MSDYPKTLNHPGYQPARITPIQNGRFTDHHGTPDRYPPVTVNNADQEERHRALGYREHGEAAKPMIDYAEYPLMLVHPGHVPAVQAETHAKREESGALTTWTTPGSEERFPPVTVNSAAEEEAWTAKGWGRPGKTDPDAVQAAIASPYVPGRETAEWPKMVDGVLVQEPGVDRSGFQRYPMWVGPTLVHNAFEEQAARGGENVATAELVRPEPGPVAPADPALAAALSEIAALKAQLADKADPAETKRAAARDRMAKVRAARKSIPATQSEAAD